MVKALATSLFATSAIAAVNAGNLASTPVVSVDILHKINNVHDTTWKAGVNERFVNATLANVATLCGTILSDDPRYEELPARQYLSVSNDDIPESFDAREGFPDCADVIGHIRDQSDCGSCWAFASTEAFNDRLCVAKGDKTLFSVEDTLACCSGFSCGMSMGCNGGQPTAAWNWFTKAGVVTGGDFEDIGSQKTCLPYEFEPCAHHVESQKYKPCPSTEYNTPRCKKTCSENDYSKSYMADKVLAKTAYSLRSVKDIQKDLMTYGSVTAAFTVYSDFPNYKTGVYQLTASSGSALGGHAVKILGWGVEDKTDYWLVANSWNEEWGDKGYFKIKRGSNECGIESQISAGTL